MNMKIENVTIASAPSTPAETTRLYADLRELIEACGPQANRHDVATVAIQACIEAGRDTARFIIGTLKNLGFNPRHVARILTDGTGSNPKRHHWQLNAQDRYILHEDERDGGTSLVGPSPHL